MPYQVADNRRGCPPRHAANRAFLQKEFVAAGNSWLVAQGHVMRSYAGRADLVLYVDGQAKDYTLTYTSLRAWEDASVFWMGYVGAGKHRVHLQSPQANIWGCQDRWGDLDLLVLAQGPGIAVHQAEDSASNRQKCPPKAAANTVLLKKVGPSAL